MVKAKELLEQTKAELEAKLHGLHEECYKLRQQATTGGLEKPHVLNAARKDIARVKTVLRQKELQEKKTLPAENKG